MVVGFASPREGFADAAGPLADTIKAICPLARAWLDLPDAGSTKSLGQLHLFEYKVTSILSSRIGSCASIQFSWIATRSCDCAVEYRGRGKVASRELIDPMVRLVLRLLAVLVVLTGLASPSGGGTKGTPPSSIGWKLEQDVETPSYATNEPASTDLSIDTITLSCEQGPSRRGLQLRLYLSDSAQLAPAGAGVLKNDPTVEFSIDGVSHVVELLFADSFVVVADAADGVMPMLSETLLDALQSGRRLELQFHLLQRKHGYVPADGTAVVDLQAGQGGAAVATVRRCADEQDPRIARKASLAR